MYGFQLLRLCDQMISLAWFHRASISRALGVGGAILTSTITRDVKGRPRGFRRRPLSGFA